jgi:hypothetical protein
VFNLKSLSQIKMRLRDRPFTGGMDFRIAAASPLLKYCLVIQTLRHTTPPVNDKSIATVNNFAP